MKLESKDIEILSMLSHGLTTKEMADKLNWTYATVETYRSRLLRRNGARTSSHLIAIAFRAGVLKTGITQPDFSQEEALL